MSTIIKWLRDFVVMAAFIVVCAAAGEIWRAL